MTGKKKRTSSTHPFAPYKKLYKQTPSKPVLFNPSNKASLARLLALLKSGEVRHIRDEYKQQLEELFTIDNPPVKFGSTFDTAFKKYYADLTTKTPEWQLGRWVYYPWISTVVHVLDDDQFQRVRTARNQNLITKDEQETFYNATVGIAGLSVGNSVALSIVLQGGARHIKLSDHDKLELSNLNRIRTSVAALGIRKVDMTARQIYEMNPYATVEVFKDGLTETNLKDFFTGLDIVVDEIDNLALKYLIREYAHTLHIPVVMAVDNGENGIVDVERYDFPNKPDLFHGRLGLVTYEQLSVLDKAATGAMIARHIGPENIAIRAWQSFKQMGKTLASWPQLGGAALLNGSAVAYVVRRIVTGQPVIDNRAIVSLEYALDPTSNSDKARQAQRQVVEEIEALEQSQKHNRNL